MPSSDANKNMKQHKKVSHADENKIKKIIIIKIRHTFKNKFGKKNNYVKYSNTLKKYNKGDNKKNNE